MVAGAVLAYPLGFTFDYALKGYLRERLELPVAWRWGLYAGYWPLAAAVLVGLAGGLTAAATALPAVGVYELVYFSVVVLAYGLGRVWRLGLLDSRYTPVVATEKRRLLSYGLIQVVIVGMGVMYAAIR